MWTIDLEIFKQGECNESILNKSQMENAVSAIVNINEM